MALIQVNFISNTLKRTVPLQVILPVDKGDGSRFFNDPQRKYPTLYLLHGLFGNCTDWVSNTRVQMWAEEKNLAVVMPSGDNSFYVDQPGPNSDYGAFIGEELVELTRRMFPLSREPGRDFHRRPLHGRVRRAAQRFMLRRYLWRYRGAVRRAAYV